MGQVELATDTVLARQQEAQVGVEAQPDRSRRHRSFGRPGLLPGVGLLMPGVDGV
jgi:hypothetical protein